MTGLTVILGLAAPAGLRAETAPPAPACVAGATGGTLHLQTASDLPADVALLCAALRAAIAERPALVTALERQTARLRLEILARDATRLSARLVLETGGETLEGAALELQQTDRGSLAPASIERLARHLIEAEPIRSFPPTP